MLEFIYIGPAGKLLLDGQVGKVLSITQHGLTSPAKLYTSSLATPYDDSQLPGSSFDVQFLEDIPPIDPGGGGFVGTITLVSKGAD
jgi:hypothetical protein